MVAAFPPALALATVTVGPVLGTDGSPVAGVTVLLVPEWDLIHAATGTRILANGASMTTGADGTASTQVVRSDAAGLVRPNVRYQVIYSGPPAAGRLPEPFPVYVNQATVDLEQVQPSSGAAGTAVPVAGVAPGGTTGQVLAKKSDADLDTRWVDPPTGGGGGAVTSVAGRTGAVVLTAADVSGTFADNQIPGSIARDSEVDAAVTAGIATRVPTTAVGAASGVASLDSAGKIPQAQLPAVALTDFLGAVGSQAAMLALPGQRGDWATRTDRGTDWQLIAEPSSSLSSWREMTYPASPVSSVAGRTGAVTLSADDLTDATTVGKAVIRAADAAAARTAIGAAVATDFYTTTFADAYRSGSSGNNSQQTIGAAFTTVVLDAEFADPANLFNTATSLYTVPTDGLYLCLAKVRLTDGNISTTFNFGLGVHTANADNPSFVWNTVPAGNTTGNQARRVFDYQRQAFFTAGQQLRLYAYADGGQSAPLTTAQLTIVRTA